MKTQVKAKKTQSYANQNPLEIVKSIGAGVTDSFLNDLGKKGITDMWDEVLGAKSADSHKNSGDLSEGQEISLSKKNKKEEPEYTSAAPAIDYHREIVESRQIVDRENQQVIKSQIQEILFELKKLTESSAEMAMEFKEVTVEQRIENPGEYHVSFFQWLLSNIRAARTKVEDAGAWMSVAKSKNGKKNNYWGMLKKHGTTFGLSNERAIATQAG